MTDIPSRLATALADRYRIERQLGEGGMATVYLAQDLKHDRKVAIKVLRPELAAVLGAERFLAEIRTTANLQHPHILPLFDSGEADGFLFYVMPYIDGETLREQLDREKQLGVDEAVRIAGDVADALEYAHSQGVIHRDIKPANILMHRGRPMVADFGIAVAVSAAGGGRMTETGLSLGTPHYMSPEQASADRDLTARSDVYSLGCVLYEMIAGQPPHTGPSAQSVLVRIMTETPRNLTELRHTVPPHVAAVVARAVEKLPADRFVSAAEFARALDDESFTYSARPTVAATRAAPATTPTAGIPARPWLRDPRSVAALVAAAALGAFGLFKPIPPPVPGVPTRAEVTGLEILRNVGGWRLAISPGGDWIAAGTREDGMPHLYVRPAGDPAWRRLPNTEGGSDPDFSPDGQSLVFSNNLLGIFRVPITGGPALPVAPMGAAPHWTADGMIVFEEGGDVFRVPANGGEPELIFASDSISAARPHMLPNGRGILFGEDTGGDPLQSRVLLLDLESGEVRVLVPSGNQPRYVATGHVVYGHGDQALMAVPFDLETLEATGSPVTLLPSLTVYTGGASQFDISETGTLLYDAGGSGLASAGNLLLAEVTMDGSQTPLPIPAGSLDAPRYSPDGRKIAYEDGSEIRVYDVVTGASPQITTGGGFYPVWSPGGEYLYFSTGSAIQADGARRRVDGSEAQELLFERESGNYINDVSAGDSILLVRENTTDWGRDLMLMRRDGDTVRWDNYLTAQWDEGNASLSPDGRWVAYQSNESGEQRIYVHSFPIPTGQRAVSPGRGESPVWSPDGRSIYYVDGSSFMAVDVTTEPTFMVSAPRLLFDGPAYQTATGRGWHRNYDIHPDGDRFLVVVSGEDVGGEGVGQLLDDVYIVVNWFEELKARMGG